MEFTGERLVPGAVDIELETEHRLRYKFAAQLVQGKRVLDAACGTGYGSAILAQNALSVCGVDISQDAITYAEDRYTSSGTQFFCGSVTNLPFDDGSFDVVVSYETLEHIDSRSQELFFEEIIRVLTDDGILVMSTPNKEVYDKRGENAFHVCERSFAEFSEMLSSKFVNVRFFSQQWETGVYISSCGECEALIDTALQMEAAEYLIAVCSDMDIPSCKSMADYTEQGKYRKVLDWAIENHHQIEACNTHIRELDDEIERYRTVIDTERQERREISSSIEELQKKLEAAEDSTNKAQTVVTNRDAHIGQLLQREHDLKETVLDQAQQIKLLSSELRDKKIEVSELTEDVDKLKGRNVELADSVSQLNEKNQNQQGHIELLLESDRELQRIKASRSCRFMEYVWKLRDWLFPKGSKRRLLCKMLVRFVKHPIQFLSKCTPKKMAKFFKTLRREGVEGTSRKLDDCLLYPQGVVSSLKISPVDIQVQKAKDDYAPLQVPKWEKPEVSIVIPVYNQFDYTYACLESIIRNSGEVSYEILIADDCSTDLTEQIDDIIGGLHTIHNEKNLRFLLNCKHAAKQARGEYILFLNNDTQVQENWLEPLVSLMQKDPSIGMTGSKLVYPDGRLQEAGGILWSDGSAWNYGNRSDPNAPEYNYVKEVDYISGASICIRRELWEEIGGFDERFVPAYCEDSDLAFEVRRHGYKVVYQPLSVVVHFEGVSNGTDVASGQKAYQVVNQKKFFEKWQQILTQDHYPNGEKVFLARERGRNAKVLLMVDHYVPQYDKDAGSRTVFQYLKLFAESGYHVKFIGDNFFPHQPYTQVLQQMGVEVLYGNWYAKNWKEWLRENGSCIEYAFLNRPHISVKYIDEVRKYTKAFIAYYGHDLHFLREYREYELTGDKGHLQDSVEWKEKELALMRKADIAYYPSVVEEQEIHRIAPEVNVKAIPAYLFADVPDADYSASSRQDVMFIGGFGHRPNVDAVVWLAKEIMPRLNTSLPGLVVHILGSNPPKEVTDLQTENLRIEGFVTDERLEQYYRECRMAIVPLRYGAGIKGKVVEAMRYGMPVLTTSVGAEGMIGAEGILAVEDTPEDFAARFVSLYKDHAALERVSRQEVAYIRENYSPTNAIRVIGKEFDIGGFRS